MTWYWNGEKGGGGGEKEKESVYSTCFDSMLIIFNSSEFLCLFNFNFIFHDFSCLLLKP